MIPLLLTAALTVSAQTTRELATLSAEVEKDLTDSVLPFWINHVTDPAGGFYGMVMSDGKPVPGAEKGAILNGRIIWTFSKAFGKYGLPQYREAADRAADYFIAHFIDPKYGGAVWSVDSEGAIKDGVKQTYATAFGIYGLAEHFRATGDRRSLDAAIGMFRTLEDKVHDHAGKGYLETFARDWFHSDTKGVDGMAGATKTMNTHIHVMEAYTTLYQVWPDEELRACIVELLDILQSKLYNPATKHLILYCDDDWKSLEEVDSFGHDIETSWLLCEAAQAIGDPEILARIRKQAVEMTDVALAEGLSEKGYMRYERNAKGYSPQLSWWPQCETIIGCVNAWQLTGDRKYFDVAVKTWEYVKAHFIDKEYGDWFKALMPDETPARGPKASMWNCPYHVSRVSYELGERLRRQTVHTEVMAWSNITGVRLEGELIDFESSLRVGTPGGEIESSGREKQQKISYHRDGASQLTVTPMHAVVVSQSVTDLDMSSVSLSWDVEANQNLKEGAYFCMNFAPKYYKDAVIKISGKKISIKAPQRSLELLFDKAVKAFIREENGDKVLYVTLLPELKEGAKSRLSAILKVDGIRHHETAGIALDLSEPGRQFAGFGGNFRIQNVQKDPEVIDYCLKNMRVAYGRVEFPWITWDKEGKDADHVKRSAEMARRLKEIGMPLIVSAWFPPQWAGNRTTRSDGTSFAFSLKPEKEQKIFESIASYLVFLKKEYGAEADFFSFNESDLGINVVYTPQEHCDFIKKFGKYLADKGLKTVMLLGDNSDATTFDFIVPALNDKDAHKYIGAVSFHSWRGCDDETLRKWAGAARQLNVPLIVGEGSTDAAAHTYPDIFNESTFAFYEINLYTRILAISQPLSILQWQLTSDYSVLWGDGIYHSEGPLRPTQRFWNLKQLSMTPENAFAIPASCDRDDINVAAFDNRAKRQGAVHIVNNAASCKAVITGLPAYATEAEVFVTNSLSNAKAQLVKVRDGKAEICMPAESFVSVFYK